MDSNQSHVSYQKAYLLYENGEYKKAVFFFLVLITRHPKQARNWQGLAASYQMLLDYKRAVQAWVVAANLSPHEPEIYYYTSFCLYLQKSPAASDFLQRAETHCIDPALKEKIVTLQHKIQEEIS